MCAEVVWDELFEESCKTYIDFRATSMLSCRCVQLGAAPRNRPSRRRRSRGCGCAGTSSDTLTSPGCRFWNWLTLTSVSESASEGDESGEDRFERPFPRAYHAPPTFTSARRRFCSISSHFEASALFNSVRRQNRNVFGAIGHRSCERTRAHAAAIARSAVSFDDVKECQALLHGKPVNVVRDEVPATEHRSVLSSR